MSSVTVPGVGVTRSTPTLFVSHGAPDFALERSAATAAMARVFEEFPSPRALLLVSPHWQTPGLAITASPAPRTLHDFGGFDPRLRALRYPSPGDPALAADIAALLTESGLPTLPDAARGLDHGAWVPLLHLRPQADLPVLQLSLPALAEAALALRIGQALAPLRARGIWVIGSGSLTHSFADLGVFDAPPPAYTLEFATALEAQLRDHGAEGLRDWHRLPGARRAHPSSEHLLPLLIAAAAAGEDATRFLALDGGARYASLLMRHYLFGAAVD
jgi:4,5-DOPA dioxygenase extradiol